MPRLDRPLRGIHPDTRRNIPGQLDPAALERLTFSVLPEGEKRAVIGRLTQAGLTPQAIAVRVGLTQEAVRSALREPPVAAPALPSYRVSRGGDAC